MPDEQSLSPEATPTTPTVPTPAPQPAPQPPSIPTEIQSQQQPAAPAPAAPPEPSCKCPVINPADWDKKRLNISKSFYKTFSPRLLHMPISYPIDIDRATKAAIKKGYKPVDKPMILDIDGLFLGSVMVEVENANKLDKDIVSFENTEVYSKVSTKPYKNIKQDIDELAKELGKQPRELYVWYVSCPKCMATKNEKAVIIAVP